METLNMLLHGFMVNMNLTNILACIFGVVVGTLTGVLPGLGVSGAMALLLPLSFGMEATPAIIMFAGIYYGAMYGGASTSILLNLPGEAASVITALDGHPLAKKGKAGAALATAAMSSFFGGTVGVIALTFAAPLLSRVALKFGPPEYFAIAIFGLILLTNLTGTNPLKSLQMIMFGLMISTIGMDSITGIPRFTFGINDMMRGIEFSVVAMAVFGINEVFSTLVEPQDDIKLQKVKFRELYPSKSEFMRMIGPWFRGTLIGFFIGLIPGPAGTLASFTSYTVEKKVSKTPELFGTGMIEGVAGPESANNAASTATMVPLLSLGLPFAPPSALLLTGFIFHGITPGPTLITQHPDVFWGLIASMYIGNIFLLILNLPFVGIFASLLRTPSKILMPIIMIITFTGAYASNNAVFDIAIVVALGLFGYLISKFGYKMAPLAIGLVLGGTIETGLVQTMALSQGNISSLLARPIFSVMMLASLVVLIFTIMSFAKKEINLGGNNEKK